jgi:hypothetical protein
VPEGAVTLPTPKQEREALLALLGFAALAIIGAGAVLGGFALLTIKLAQWVFA